MVLASVLTPDIDVPAGTLHALASLGPSQIQVHEVQTGTCRESDIERYADHSGLSVVRSFGAEGRLV